MKILNLNEWKRRKQYEFFKAMDCPHFNLCFPLDISRLRPFCQEKRISLTHSILYLSSRSANEIPEFRLRIRGEEVVEHETVHPSYTVLREDETFSFCSVQYTEDPAELFQQAQEEQDRVMAETVMEDEPGRDDYLFISIIPWVSFTSFSHPMHVGSVDSVPRLSWGKYYEDGAGKTLLPYSVQLHHALADGLHIGKFEQVFQALADVPEETFASLLE